MIQHLGHSVKVYYGVAAPGTDGYGETVTVLLSNMIM